MPLSTDPEILRISGQALEVLHQINSGPHPGFRPAHAKGILVKGTFRPTEEAKTFSKAPHFNNPETPITGRFSNAAGIPDLPDTDPQADSRALAVRFHLAETPRRVHTDIITVSSPLFPVRTPAEALDFFRALRDGTVEEYAATRPKVAEFLQTPKQTPAGFGTAKYFNPNAHKLVAADGCETLVRYRFLPVAGEKYLTEEEVKGRGDNFMIGGVGPALCDGPIEFKLVAQVAAEGDVTDNASEYWPEERKVVELGTMSFTSLVENSDEEQKKIIFDPKPRGNGVEPSGDPLIELRGTLYLMSGLERRGACPLGY